MTTTVDRPNGTALATRTGADIIEAVIARGDLAQLEPEQRVSYYREVCRSLGLNELTRPFEYISLNGKLTLYPRKDCTDQLRKLNSVNITRLERDYVGDLYAVTAYATDAQGRQDSAIGAVSIVGLKGEALANALMKAETKAKRRVTLSLCGLGWTDEAEVESIPSGETVIVDAAGKILQERPAPTRERDVEDAPRPQAQAQQRAQGQGKPSASMVASEDDVMWQRWLELKSLAEGVGVVVPPVSLPIGRQLLQSAGMKLRDQVLAHEHAGEQAIVSTKDDPLWQEWLEAEKKVRQAGLKLDTSQVKLPISQESLRASIDGLNEALKSSDLDIPF